MIVYLLRGFFETSLAKCQHLHIWSAIWWATKRWEMYDAELVQPTWPTSL